MAHGPLPDAEIGLYPFNGIGVCSPDNPKLSGLMLDHYVEEEPLHAGIGGHLGMEGGDEQVPLAHQGRKAIALGEHFNIRTYARDARRSDEDHLQRAAGQLGREGEDGGVNLTAVCVALNCGVEHCQAALRRVQHLARQQDAAGACSEAGSGGDKLPERVKESILLEELEHSGRFAARYDESIETGQLLRLSHQHRARSCPCEGARMSLVIALEGEYADRDGIDFPGAFQCRSFLRGCH